MDSRVARVGRVVLHTCRWRSNASCRAVISSTSTASQPPNACAPTAVQNGQAENCRPQPQRSSQTMPRFQRCTTSPSDAMRGAASTTRSTSVDPERPKPPTYRTVGSLELDDEELLATTMMFPLNDARTAVYASWIGAAAQRTRVLSRPAGCYQPTAHTDDRPFGASREALARRAVSSRSAGGGRTSSRRGRRVTRPVGRG